MFKLPILSQTKTLIWLRDNNLHINSSKNRVTPTVGLKVQSRHILSQRNMPRHAPGAEICHTSAGVALQKMPSACCVKRKNTSSQCVVVRTLTPQEYIHTVEMNSNVDINYPFLGAISDELIGPRRSVLMAKKRCSNSILVLQCQCLVTLRHG